MPQGPIATANVTPTTPAYNIAAATVVKASPGHIAKIIVQVAPSAGNLIVNDLAANSGAAIGNQILELAFGSLTEGQVIDLGNWPCKTGILISSVGTGGVYAVSFT